MYTLGSIIGVVGFFAMIYAMWRLFRQRKKPGKKLRWAFLAVTFALMLAGGAIMNSTPRGKAELAESESSKKAESTSKAAAESKASSESKAKAKKAAAASKKAADKKKAANKKAAAESKKNAAAKASSKSESIAKAKAVSSSKKAAASSKKAEKAAAKEALTKQKETNYQNFLKKVADTPNRTNQAITAASYDESTRTLTMIVTDDILGVSAAQLKVAIHNAWQGGVNLIENSRPMPDSKVGAADMVTIKDSAGDVLAETGWTGGFKYRAE